MEKKYILEGLDCPNCAMKIEKALNKREEVNSASVNAATLGCTIQYKDYSEEIERKLIHLIEELEEVHVVEKKGHAHHEKACGCEHHHHHHEHEHHHDHDHECSIHDHHEHHENIVRVQPAGNDLKKIKWTIEGLDCASCAMKVEDAVNKVEGVEYASLNFTTKALLFYIKKNADEKIIKEKIKKAILDTEEVQIIEENEKKEKKKNYQIYVLGIGTLIFLLSLVFDWQIGVILSYFMIGYSVIVKALKNIRRGEIFDENFLMMIATIGAIVVGEYLEAVAVMLFYQVGEYFQNKAVERSRNSIADLMNIKAEIAHLKTGDHISDVDPEQIKIKDIIVVQPGERIPLDGIVRKGTSALDTSALTGESLPREVAVEDEVLAGCINLNGVIEVEVTHELSESTVSRILDMVENASGKKAKTELKMTRFARVYTPIVVIAALILAIVPNFFPTQISWQEWLIRACTFLVISCPCALVLSIPLGYFAGIGSASKKGILVKGGNYLEILSQIDTIVFDKTGTLTNGSFEVTNIYGDDPKECLRLAAIAESYSTHPIAQSIQKEYGKEIDKNELVHVEEIAGHGIKGEYQGKILLAGNKKLMDRFHITCQEQDSYGTLVYVAYDSRYIGTIEIRDTLKANTKESLKSLKEKGIKKLVMLTGDRKKTAQAIADECGIDEVHYELLPTDKVNELEKILNASSGKVAYVGDGINDAPVLARSDLGIAMGGLGSEAAVEASDLVLMKDDLSSLSQGIDLARFTQRIMNENIIFILGVKAIILILSIFGYANMWLGVFADVGVSLIAVINAMRILKK
ncbi:heavy metal translocating P-type ATPase [uncultured Traorella sp.]|uniref:heavy metal translocating P-type ATPase n=1 Tax=uncultured Traorella sp. TaxID=1929048 RepID=UPI0025DA2EC9|nr:heavy metal translocating P-type ATPase [uncultured Traorella sp.]